MRFSKDFFDLNLKFARRISDVTGQGLEKALLEYTHLYLAFGLGRDFDDENSIWQSYLHRLKNQPDLVASTHRFYLGQTAKRPKPEPEHAFGCFSYTLWTDCRVRLHFRNAMNKRGALQTRNISERLAELKSMFGYLKKTVPIMSTVVGGSWLYNIEAYRRLFPPNYLESAQAGEGEYQFISLWGQFLCHDGDVRQPMAERFLQAMETQKTLEGLKNCFPYQVLRLASSMKNFYLYYGIE
jgi:hypothetical protein